MKVFVTKWASKHASWQRSTQSRATGQSEKQSMKSLENTMRFTTDKIEPHGYFPTYLKLASQIGTQGRICEVGISGSSLHMWQALFPNGIVVGVDNNRTLSWPDGTVKIVADQDDETLPRKLL